MRRNPLPCQLTTGGPAAMPVSAAARARKLLAALCICWLCSLLAQPAAARAPDGGSHASVTLANGEWPPYLSEKLPYYGGLSRVVTEAFVTQGIHVDYRFYPWRRAFVEAEQGAVDGSVLWTSTPERQASFLFSAPVFTTEDVLFFRKAQPVHWQHLSDLAGIVLGGTIGYTYGDEFGRLESEGVLHVERIANEEINFQKLLIGRIGAFPMDREVGIYILAHSPHNLGEQIDFDPKVILSAPLYLIVSKKTPGGAELIRRFNAGLAELKRSGRVDQYIAEARATH